MFYLITFTITEIFTNAYIKFAWLHEGEGKTMVGEIGGMAMERDS